jgi:hypothetical protein
MTLGVAPQVVQLHNALATAANMEARQIATHEDVWRCVYHAGSRERYVPWLQTAPAFEERPVADAIAARDGGEEGEFEALERRLAEDADAAEIAEFERTLAWSMGEVRGFVVRITIDCLFGGPIITCSHPSACNFHMQVRGRSWLQS